MDNVVAELGWLVYGSIEDVVDSARGTWVEGASENQVDDLEVAMSAVNDAVAAITDPGMRSGRVKKVRQCLRCYEIEERSRADPLAFSFRFCRNEEASKRFRS